MPDQYSDREPRPEFAVAIQAGPLWDEITHDLAVWREYKNTEFSGELGMQARVEDCSPLLKIVTARVGTDHLCKYSREPIPLDLYMNLYLNEARLQDKELTYVNDEQGTRLINIMRAKGCTDIVFESGTYSNHYVRFRVDGESFKLNLGFRSREEHLKDWEKYRTGQPPLSNYSMRLEADCQDIPDERIKFLRLCSSFSSAATKVFASLGEFYGIPAIPREQIEVQSSENFRRSQQSARGYMISSYETNGEFHWDGTRVEPIYGGIDHLVWKRQQREIYENRGLGNRQIVTIAKDRVVFGRWGGASAGEQQADILIDGDINPGSFTLKGERVVSRRHFAVAFNSKLNDFVSGISGGVVKDAVLIENLQSANGFMIFRRSGESMLLYGRSETLGGDSGRKRSFLLPGDLVFITPSLFDYRQATEERRFESKGIGLIYLGNKRFVKLQFAPGTLSMTEILKDLAAVVTTTPEEAMLAQAAVDRLDLDHPDSPVLTQALQVVRDYVRGKEDKASFVGWTDEEIQKEDPERLMILLGRTFGGEVEIDLKGAQRIVELRSEEPLVSYAFLRIITGRDIEATIPLLSRHDIWRKLSLETCLHTLDLVETSSLSDGIKREILGHAFAARDDTARPIIRSRLERYSS